MTTVTEQRWIICKDCGQPFYRSRTFTGPEAAEDARQWTPEATCLSCQRAEDLREIQTAIVVLEALP